jgi:hypothetical protein
MFEVESGILPSATGRIVGAHWGHRAPVCTGQQRTILVRDCPGRRRVASLRRRSGARLFRALKATVRGSSPWRRTPKPAGQARGPPGPIAAGSLSAFRATVVASVQVGRLDGINGPLVMRKSRVRIPQAARRTPCAPRTRPPQRPGESAHRVMRTQLPVRSPPLLSFKRSWAPVATRTQSSE